MHGAYKHGSLVLINNIELDDEILSIAIKGYKHKLTRVSFECEEKEESTLKHSSLTRTLQKAHLFFIIIIPLFSFF